MLKEEDDQGVCVCTLPGECQTQRNQGLAEGQERVRGEFSDTCGGRRSRRASSPGGGVSALRPG